MSWPRESGGGVFPSPCSIPTTSHTSVSRNRQFRESYFEQGQKNKFLATITPAVNNSEQESERMEHVFGNPSNSENVVTNETSEEHLKVNQKRRKRKVYRVVRVSCVNCRQSKQACDEFRPCARCIRLGLEEMCVDAPSSRPRPLSSQIPNPNDKLFSKVQIHKELDRLASLGSTLSSVDTGKYNSRSSDIRNNTAEISHLLSPLFSNGEHLRDSFISRYYSGEGSHLAAKCQESALNLGTEKLEDTVLEAVYELSKMITLWDQDLQSRERQLSTKEEIEDIAKSHSLFCYVLRVLNKFLQLWGIESFSDNGKRVQAILQSLQNLTSAKPDYILRMRSYLPTRKVKLTAEQQHEFLANIPMACLKMSLRIDDSFHKVDFANKEACDLFSASEEDLSILIGCKETLPIVLGGIDWIQKPMFLLRLLTENTLKRVQVYHLVTFDGSLFKCNSAERLGQDPLAGSFLHRVVSHVKSERIQSNMDELTKGSQRSHEVFASGEASGNCYSVSSSTVLHM
ncbi:hypothetical protein Gasu2_46970 [Galdieria sulphuraria]|nr:hypothetical protein Gasu2_46970 [Galdieria sulphuraria]